MNTRADTPADRNTRRPCWTAALVMFLASIGAAQTPGTNADTAAPKDPLAAKQQIVRDRMTQLEDRMFRLAEKLKTVEPRQAERLTNALRQTRELLIRRNMEESIGLLDEGQLTEAADRQLAIIKDLEQVLKTLLEEPDDTERRRKEIDRLQAYRDQIKALLEEQQALKARTDGVPATAPASATPASRPAESGTLAEQQQHLRQRTHRLGDQMENNAPLDRPKESPQEGKAGDKGDANKSGQPDGDHNQEQPDQEPKEANQPPQGPAPGTQNVRQAAQHMSDAAEKLDGNNNADASQDQGRAIDQLQRAMDELQQTLDQLRREQQEEILRGLEARFRAMLAQQIVINDGTKKLQSKGQPAWTHEDELWLVGLAHDEQGLANEADQALRILQDEGTTIVFPRMVAQLREDMNDVTKRLGDSDTGDETQRTQALIVETLEELIEAVKQLRDQLSGGGAGGGGGGINPPLLPASAELKLLRSCQQRVNRRTIEYHDLLQAGQPITPELENKLERLADQQNELADMARKMNERITGQ